MTDAPNYELLAEWSEAHGIRYCNRCGQVGFRETTQTCDVCGYRPVHTDGSPS